MKQTRSGITHVAATVDVQSHKFVPHWVVSATVDVQRRQTVRQSCATVPMPEAGRIGSEDLMPLSSLQQYMFRDGRWCGLRNTIMERLL